MSHSNVAITQNVIENSNSTSLKLEQLIYQYKIAGMKLHAISDDVPATELEEKAFNDRETFLMDHQADLLETAVNTEIKTINDVKAILGLWRHEVIECQFLDNISASDALIESVCRFLNVE